MPQICMVKGYTSKKDIWKKLFMGGLAYQECTKNYKTKKDELKIKSGDND